MAALHEAGLLGAPAEERFDRLTRLARRLLGVPVALVSILDADRQFFLSAQGLPEPWAGLRQTPLAYSFCRSVVETELPMSVSDAREDPRVRGNPAIEDLGVIAYLAVPLALPDGCVIGALCGIDHRPRAWTAAEEGALRDLAGAVEAEMAAGLRLREAEAAAAALRESEARYRALFEVSPQMVWFADAEGRCTHVNQQYADFVGLPAERALGDGWLAAVHPEDRAGARAAWAGAVASEGDYEVEYRIRRGSDGSHRWFLVRGAPLRGPDGRVERWIGVGIDIDDRRRAEAALRGLIEALGVAVYTTDAAGRLTFYNEAAVALWGWRPPLGDAPLVRLLAAPLAGRHADAARGVPDGRGAPGEPAHPRRGGAWPNDPTASASPSPPTRRRCATTPAASSAGSTCWWTSPSARPPRWPWRRAKRGCTSRWRRAGSPSGSSILATGAVLRAPFHDAIFGYESAVAGMELRGVPGPRAAGGPRRRWSAPTGRRSRGRLRRDGRMPHPPRRRRRGALARGARPGPARRGRAGGPPARRAARRHRAQAHRGGAARERGAAAPGARGHWAGDLGMGSGDR